MTSPWRLLFGSGVFALVGFGGWGAEPCSQFLMLDGFKAKPGVERGELKFQGYGGYEVCLVSREGLSRLDLRFGTRGVPLFRTGAAFGYGEESWLANKPLEWRGEKVGGVFEPYALIFRAFRPRSEGGRPLESYVVVSLEGCDARVIGSFPAAEGPLDAVRHADRECRGTGEGRLVSSRRLLVERAVAEWLEAVRGGDEKRLRAAYSSRFLRSKGSRVGRLDTALGRIARLGASEATGFSVKEEGGKLDVLFSLARGVGVSEESDALQVKLGMLMEGKSLKIFSESVGGVPSERSEGDKGADSRVVSSKRDEPRDAESDLSQLMVGRWLASDGKGMMSLVFEEGGRVTRKRIGSAGKGDSGASGAWAVRDGVLVLDLGKGEEERKLTPTKGGRFKLEGRGGVLFLEKQR